MESGTEIAVDREAFERDGFVVFEMGIPSETLDGAVADLDGEFHAPEPHSVLQRLRNRGKPGYSAQGPDRIQDAWRVSENVKRIALAPAALELLRKLYGREPLPFQTLNFRVGTQQAPHSDTIHFNSKPPGYMCGIWVALEDIDAENGPLVYYPGSQRLPEVTPADVGIEPEPGQPEPSDEDYHGAYEPHIQQLIEREGLEARYATIAKGQALLWSANLLHGGAPQRNGERTRLSQVTHYFFEECKYWTPLLSGTDHVAWRDPVRIE